MRTLPKAPERLSCEIGMLAILLLQFWEILETCPKNSTKTYESLLFTGPGLAEMSNGCIVLDKKVCPDLLEALKLFWDPTNSSK